MKKSKLPKFEIATLAVGELAVSLVCALVFALLEAFDFSVILGSLLGSLVVIFNFLWLSVSVNRAVDKALLEKPDGELDDEAVERFSENHTAAVQNAAKLSYIMRTVTMLITLVLAFLLDDVFNVIATLVPILAFTPILTVGEMIKRRFNR